MAITQYGIPLEDINIEEVISTSSAYASSQILTGQVNSTYNIICFLIAFAQVPLARKIGAKGVHFVSLLVGGIAILSIPLLDHGTVLFPLPNPFGVESMAISELYLAAFGQGLTWASMMPMPYQLLAGAVPANKTGVYMGIFNMFIVIPMILQILTVQFFVYDLLEKDPVNVIRLAGVFLILASIFTLFIKTRTRTAEYFDK
ncbi:MAG TPA: hypothetical protein VLQ91_15200 [Draconibacterium sp.]|nr:hypothetical protein [Draconibacterium sp.]